MGHLAVQLTCVCCLCDMYEVNYLPWTEATNFVFVFSFAGVNPLSRYALCDDSVYFLCITTMVDGYFGNFAVCYSAVAYLRTSIP